MKGLGIEYVASIVTNIVIGLAVTIAGCYAFVVVYGWWTFAAMFAVAAVAQVWHWWVIHRVAKIGEAEDLAAAVERNREN